MTNYNNLSQEYKNSVYRQLGWEVREPLVNRDDAVEIVTNDIGRFCRALELNGVTRYESKVIDGAYGIVYVNSSDRAAAEAIADGQRWVYEIR